MNIYEKSLLLVGILLSASLPCSAYSKVLMGGMEGAGGGGVVCRTQDGNISSAEVLDLYEGRIVYGLNYTESKTPWQSQGELILTNAGLQEYRTLAQIRDWYRDIQNNLVFLPKDTKLKVVDDSFEAIKPPQGCNVEQIINYQSDTRVLVDSEIWDSLSSTQKSALIMHEAVYRILRNSEETNSKRSRHFVAHLFSGRGVQDSIVDNSYRSVAHCKFKSDKYPNFYIVNVITPDGQERIRFYFSKLNRTLLSSTYLELDRYVMGSNRITDILAETVKPTQSNTLILMGYTSSLFEAGDKIFLFFEDDDSGNITSKFIGTSVVDGSTYSMDFSCSYM